jgi:hypothetical protein
VLRRSAILLVCYVIANAACQRKAAPPAPAPPKTTLASHASPPSDLDLPPSLQALLATGTWDATPKGFRIIALSFLADSCLAQGQADERLAGVARACIARCAELGRQLRPAALDLRHLRHGIWASHYGLILGAADRLGLCLDDKAHREVATALAGASLADPRAHVSSYPDQPFRWPADQTATLAALHRFDGAHDQHLADEPIRRWTQYMREHGTDARLGLPHSEVTGKAKAATVPRGCALSFQTRYLHEFEPGLAAAWWRAYRQHYLLDAVVVVGFREWPEGREHPADTDSGPIVRGIGTAASALAIAAARAMDDDMLATRLTMSASAARRLAGAAAQRAADTDLAAAILSVGAHVPRQVETQVQSHGNDK